MGAGLDGDQGLSATPITPGRSVSRRLSDLLHGRPRLALGLLLSGPLGWLVIAYLGSLAVLFISAFWQLDTFSGAIVKEPTTANFELLWSNDVYRTIALRTIGIAALVTVTDAILAFPIAFYMAKVATPRVRGLLVVAVLALGVAAAALPGRRSAAHATVAHALHAEAGRTTG